MKKFVILATIPLLCSQFLFADYGIVVKLKNGNSDTLSAKDIKRIEFANVSKVETDKYPYAQFELRGNAPNPATGNTSILFYVNQANTFSIKIFNVNGKLILNRGNIEGSVGLNQFDWNCRDTEGNKVPNGMYYYELTSCGVSLSKSIMINN